jgi:pilus assembly protein Flp/PilA
MGCALPRGKESGAAGKNPVLSRARPGIYEWETSPAVSRHSSQASIHRKEPEDMLRAMHQFLTDFLKNEEGPTAVEYAVMLALIIVVCLAAITTVGTNASLTFSKIGSATGSS